MLSAYTEVVINSNQPRFSQPSYEEQTIILDKHEEFKDIMYLLDGLKS